MDLSGAVEQWAEAAERRRAVGGSFVDGAWVPGSDDIATISGMFAPTLSRFGTGGGDMRMELQEGVVEESDWFFWSLDDVVHDDVIQRLSDGSLYRVISVKDYSHLGNYWLAALKLEPST